MNTPQATKPTKHMEERNKHMRVLVIEDKQKHVDSARETLADHDLTIVTSFDEAMKLLDIYSSMRSSLFGFIEYYLDYLKCQ